uniref:CBS domain-containing protein n=1 Tax=Haptolina brevifila TaxID=156173 RepID=A0A7S2D571_9EUKA
MRGILTDTDVTRKVLALGHDPERFIVDSIMTPEPRCIASTSTAAAALCTMMEHNFRHLPVISESFEVQGVLDIAKCLHDAVSSLDSLSLGSSVKLGSLLPPPSGFATGGGAHSKSGGACIATTANVRQAAVMMAKRRSGILVEAAGTTERGGACAGIITPKDLLSRVVAAGLPAGSTAVQAVMTPKPDTMRPSDTVLDALRQLQGSGYRTVPIVTASGAPVGVLDILALMRGGLQGSSSHQSSRARTTTSTSVASSTDGMSMRDAASLRDETESIPDSDAASMPPSVREPQPVEMALGVSEEMARNVAEVAGGMAEMRGAVVERLAESVTSLQASVASVQAALLTELAKLEAKIEARAEEPDGRRAADLAEETARLRWVAIGAPLIFAAGVLVGGFLTRQS